MDTSAESELKALAAFVLFAKQKGYDAYLMDDYVVIRDVTNKNNNFRLANSDGYYKVNTICVSPLDYEYTAKCTVYMLLAQYNQANAGSTHLHINFKVDL
ncbi:hypothetical protein FO440_11480 [Mucilaginibacter corticis]|uniref:Uncharacterized protein n=1 Tax=Mucilaginibacter corticis TaxID=2597670 RepID=A0A556MKH6_9SPHI|nr:hypothetical protein [Mucilaginibacter corticis]TSJ40373.1 hypothetical protein FO440_11480 [Mucilaginibacter corticis]